MLTNLNQNIGLWKVKITTSKSEIDFINKELAEPICFWSWSDYYTVDIKSFSRDSGSLFFVEEDKDLIFGFKRIFYIKDMIGRANALTGVQIIL